MSVALVSHIQSTYHRSVRKLSVICSVRSWRDFMRECFCFGGEAHERTQAQKPPGDWRGVESSRVEDWRGVGFTGSRISSGREGKNGGSTSKYVEDHHMVDTSSLETLNFSMICRKKMQLHLLIIASRRSILREKDK